MKTVLTWITFAFTSFFCCAQDYTQQAATAMHKKQPQLALHFLRKAEQEAPENLNVLLQLATTHFVMHDYTTAASYYERAVALNPGHINVRYNCAMAHSKYGNFARALEQYETVYQKLHNEKVKGHLFKLYIRCKKWDKAYSLQPPELWWYTENIYGTTILLDIDKPGNGFGDGIQFIRYAQTLKQSGATVFVKAPNPLVPLLKRCAYIDQVFAKDEAIPAYDTLYNICIASLLLRTKDQIMMRTPQRPYLSADPELVNFWSKEIHPNSNFKIGLCWQSNLVQDSFNGKIMPSSRSISLEELAPLADTNITFYSLQKVTDPITPPFPLTQFTQDFDESHGRFMDTAALIMNMDLIITVDTSIAHLAGALGKPVWLLLSCESDYRWFTDMDTSPLYPDMQLFRQQAYGDWKPVIESMKKALCKRTHTSRNPA